MQAKIDTLRVKDESGEEYLLYPKTLTKSVTDEDGNTLANMLSDMQDQIEANAGGSGNVNLTGYVTTEAMVEALESKANTSDIPAPYDDSALVSRVEILEGLTIDTVTPSIGDNGNWYVGDTDTGVKAQGSDGVDGLDGEDGKGVMSMSIDGENFVTATYSDGTTESVGQLKVDLQNDFLTEEGFGKLRFYNNVFQYYDDATSAWVDFQMTEGNTYIMQLSPQTMKYFALLFDRALSKYKFRFTEPDDTTINGQAVCIVEGVKIVRKLGSEPTDENDGTLVLDLERPDFGKYNTNYFIDEDLTVEYGETWYYKAFPYSNTGIVCYSSANMRYMTAVEHSFFGFRIDQTESDPASMITYLPGTDNEFYKSAYMDCATGTFNYGDWKDAWFISGLKPCMLNNDGTVAYELNPNDYTKKIDCSDANITDTYYAGNVMVGIPLVYYKVVLNDDADICDFYFSDKKLDDEYQCWAHINADGETIPYTYVSSYGASLTSNVYRSISGLRISSQDVATATRIGYASANNADRPADWNIMTIADKLTIDLLLLLIGKSTDTQTVFGYGHSDNDVSSTINGSHNKSGLFMCQSNTSTSYIKVFGIEHYWHSYYECIAGLYINSNKTVYLKLTHGQEDGSTVDGYTNVDISSGLALEQTLPTTSGYISKMNFTKYGFMYPKAVNGSTTTYYADYLESSTNTYTYLSYGSSSNAKIGIFTMMLQSTDGKYSTCHLSCKPPLSAFEEV